MVTENLLVLPAATSHFISTAHSTCDFVSTWRSAAYRHSLLKLK